MALKSRLRLLAALAACAAIPVVVDKVRSADDAVLSVAGLEADVVPAAVVAPEVQPLAPAPVLDPTLLAPPSPAAEPLLPSAGPLADRTAVPPVHPELQTVDRVLDLYRKGDLAGGDAVAAGLKDPAASALVQWAAIRLAPREVGSQRIEAFIAREPGWPTQALLRRRVEEALLGERASPARLMAYFAAHPPVTVTGKLTRARLLAQRGHATEAVAAVRALWRDDDFGAELEDAVLDAFPRAITPADHMARTERALAGEDWKDAQRSAARAGSDYQKLASARMATARAAADAQAQLDAVPKSLQATPSYLFAKAQLLRRKDKAQEAAAVMRQVSPTGIGAMAPEEWWTERRVLARKLLDQGDPKLAYEVAAGRPAAPGAYVVEAEFHAGWIALRFLDDAPRAAAHFATAARTATTPISVSRAAYWRARAVEAQGQDATALYEEAALHPMTYYGQLARARIGRTDFALRKPEPPAEGENRLATALRLLLAADSRDLAIPLMVDAAQRERDPRTVTALAHVVEEFGDARAALALGKAATQRGLPLDAQAFPMGGMPASAIPADAVETALAFAIARQESAFDPKAQSGAGARGLMQLMPATAKETASRAGLPFALDRLTADPAYNATLGATYLGDLASSWRGSYVLAIASYNAGAGNVKKWIEAYGDPRNPSVDVVDWVERIPFTETRNYVQRVIENLQVYRRRLGETALLIEEDLRRGAGRPPAP